MTCMRHDPANHGRCPVADDAPQLSPENDLAVTIYRESLGSANQIEAKDKVYVYPLPSEVFALMQVYGISEEGRPELLLKIRMLADIANELRPLKEK